MHGIVRDRNFNQDSNQTSYIDINQVVVRYSDGRSLTFVPEAGRENFSEDDMRELAKVLERAYSAAEWAEVGNTADADG
jgi:hypothetical protein